LSRPFAAPEVPPAADRFRAWLRSPGVRREAIGFVGTVIALVLLGSPIGLIWAAVSPHPEYVLTATSVDLVSPETKAFVAADGIFLIMSLVIGLASGVAAYLLGRAWGQRGGAAAGRAGGTSVAAGLAVGGVLGALVAWKVGALVGHDSFVHLVRTGRDGLHVHGYVFVRAHGVLMAWGFAAVVAFAGCLLWFDRAGEPARSPSTT
jgi:hypothetical protein